MIQRQSHDSLIQGLIDHFVTKGLEVAFANYGGYEKPFIIKRHSPDVMARDPSTGLIYIGLVKLCTSLEDQITKEEFQDFSKRIMKSSGTQVIRVPFYIAVPQNCQDKIRWIFKKFEIPWKENIHILAI